MPSYTSGIEFAAVSGYFAQNVDNILGSIPAKGTITITPEPYVIVGNSGYGQVGAQTVITLIDGRIVNPNNGQTFVPIVASNSANIEPTNFTYTASLDFEHLDGVYSFSFVALANTTVDLTTVIPVDPSRGIYVGPEAVLAAVTAAANSAAAGASSASAASTSAQGYMVIASQKAAEVAARAIEVSDAALRAQAAETNANLSAIVAQSSAAAAAASAANSDASTRIPYAEKDTASGVSTLTSVNSPEPATVAWHQLPIESLRALITTVINELNNTTPPAPDLYDGGSATSETGVVVSSGNVNTNPATTISGGSA